MNSFTRKTFLLGLTLALGMLFIFMLIYLPDKNIKTITHSGVYYDSSSANQGLAALKEFFDEERFPPQEISISFEMRPYDLYYGNVFQTDSYRKGMRMELYAPAGKNEASLDIFIGWLPNLNIEKRYNLLKDVKINERYSVDINLDKDKVLKVFINGKRVLREMNMNVKYSASDVVVGSGYNKERGFKGEISNFKIEYTIVKPNYLFIIIKIILTILFLYALYKLKFKNPNGLLRFLSLVKASIIENKVSVCGLITVLSSVALYNLIFFNKYFPLAEGWFSVYANYLLHGAMPYRDFHFMLPPLYPIQMAAFIYFFGNDFIALRFIGVFLILSIASVLFILYRRLFPVYAASLATIVSVIFYQSGTAHINYDFLHFLTLYSLLSLYFMIRYRDTTNDYAKEADSSKINIFIFLSGFFACLTLLIKQSNGLMVNFFLFFAFLAVTFKSSRRFWLRNLVSYLLGLAVPLSILLVWLAINSSLKPFIQQVVFDSVYAKGTLTPILFAWFPRLMTSHNINALIIAAIILVVVVITNFIRKRLKLRDGNQIPAKTENRIIGLGILLIILFSCILLPYFEINLSKEILSSVVFIELYYSLIVLVTAVSFVIVCVYLFKAIFSFQLSDYNYNTFMISALSLGLLYGTGTSGGFASAGAFLGLGLLLKCLFDFPRPLRSLGKAVFFVCCFALIIFMVSQKYTTPYKWWGLATSDIRESISSVDVKPLSGFYLPENTIKIISDIKDIVQENTPNPSDSVYTFPNIPFFYLLTNRFPATFGVVHWFDFTSDKVATGDAQLILSTPPKVIIMFDLPDYVWADHEKLFRNGKPLKQRVILNVLQKITSEPGKYILKAKYDIPDGYVLKVWVRTENFRATESKQ